MTAPADLILTNAEVHTLTDPDETASAVAIRDGELVRVGRAEEVSFLRDVETRVIDCAGRVVLPGFIDAHTHLPMVGRRLVNADLRAADSPDEAVAVLHEHARTTERATGTTVSADRDDDWVLGFGFDESTWDESRYLTRSDLDAVSADRPVAAFREDMHVASLNEVALGRLRGAMPDSDVHVDGDDVTGVVVEEALDVVWRAVEPDHDRLLALVHAAQERATELGVTGVHDMVRGSAAPAVYRELDRVGELSLRVRLNYWADHLDALDELGLRTNHGSGMVRTGAVKTYTDGSIGARTAKLWAPYADAAEQSGDTGETPTDATSANRGQWVVAPDELQDIAAQAETGDRQLAAHAIGDEAIAATLDVLADSAGHRHRVEHAEVLTDDLVERLGEGDVVVSAQPNFLKWARTGGLYDRRLGVERSRSTNRFRDLLDAGAQLAFGSDCMPLGPLFGVEQAVTAPADGQRLSPTEALRAYTWGGAYAGFDEDRLGTAEPGKRADLVVLEASPWAVDPDDIGAIDVALTLVDGQVVHDGR